MGTQEGEQYKSEGQRRTAETNATWRKWALLWANHFASTNGEVSVDDVRDICIQENYWPVTPAVWGTLFSGRSWWLIRRQKSRHATNNARSVYVWRHRALDDPEPPKDDLKGMTATQAFQYGVEYERKR